MQFNKRARFSVQLFCLLLLYHSCLFAQTSEGILVIGKAMDAEQPQLRLEQVMVINLRTQSGIFASPDNRFSVRAEKNDTLVVTAIGYRSVKICFRDSALKTEYSTIVPLNRLSYDLKEATVFVPRDLNRIQQDIQTLGYNAKDYRLTGVDAWQSPLTALYQEFSRKERSKRKVAELMNTDRRRELLREVLANYSRSGLIRMPYNEYNAFIDYLGLSDFLLKTFSQYELAVYIKEKYLSYSSR